MATGRRRAEREPDKVAEGGVNPDSESGAMERFKSLARRLLTVSREDLAAEQRKHAENKGRQRDRGG